MRIKIKRPLSEAYACGHRPRQPPIHQRTAYKQNPSASLFKRGVDADAGVSLNRHSNIGPRTALAWMNIADQFWRYDVIQHALHIGNAAAMECRRIEAMPETASIPRQDVVKVLAVFRDTAQKIIDVPTTPPITATSHLEEVELMAFVKERLHNLWKLRYGSRFPPPTISADEQANRVVCVVPKWLQYALDLLVNHACQNMESHTTRQLTVRLWSNNTHTMLELHDTGTPISAKVRTLLFDGNDTCLDEALDDDRDRASLNMLVTQAIVESYNGSFDLISDKNGNTYTISLPLARQEPDR